MKLFRKKYKFCPTLYGCLESTALEIFLTEKEKLESLFNKKVKFLKVHHRGGYVDYILYTLEDK